VNILSSLVAPVSGLLDKVIEDKDQRNALAHEIATMSEKHSQEALKGQLEINKVEAAHHSIFVSGWRPSIGWCCSLGLLYHVLIAPIAGIWVEVPEIDPSLLMTTMTGMLGLVASRSYEKTKGVSREK